MTPTRLILMRHAKSAWDTDAPTDHARPLNKRGRRDAPRIAQALRDRAWLPHHVLASTSARTQETYQRMQLDPSIQLTYQPDIYEASPAQLLHTLHHHPPTPHPTTLLLLGHNPGLQDLLLHLTGLDERMPTAACALLLPRRPELPWPELLQPHSWHLTDLLRPRELP